MSEDLIKRAAEMLLNGGTLLSEKCPYCSGVRVLKNGCALCISCGREPEKREVPDVHLQDSDPEGTLEEKIKELSKKLAEEKDHKKQQEILKSISSVLEALKKTKEFMHD